MDTVKICGMAILAAVCVLTVKRVNSAFDMPIRIAVTVVFFGFVTALSLPLFGYLEELVSSSELSEWQGVLFGAVGIAFVTHLTAEICRESGEGTLSGYVELVGKIEILLLCLPLIGKLLEEVEGLVG